MHGFYMRVCEQHGGIVGHPHPHHHLHRRQHPHHHRGNGGRIGGRKPREKEHNQHYVAQWNYMKLLKTLSLYRVTIALLGTTSVLVVW